MKYTDIRRLEKILEYTEKLHDYIFGTKLEKQKLIEDYTIQWAVTTPLYNIGEHVYYLSSELKEKHSEIKWHMISGLRHRLVHDYDDTNWKLIADIIFKDLPELKEQIAKILTDGENPKNDEE